MNSSDKLARKKFITIVENNSVIDPIVSSGFYTLCKSNSLDTTLSSCIKNRLCPSIDLRPDYVNTVIIPNSTIRRYIKPSMKCPTCP